MRNRLAVFALALAAAGCTYASDCKLVIPEAQRADAMRFAIDRGLVDQDFVPRDDLSLALGAGRPYGTLTDAERTELARHAAGYAACIRERVNRARQ
jgi:hypothetical protein